MNEFTLTFNSEITYIKNAAKEALTKEEVEMELVKCLKEKCGFDDVHLKKIKIFETGAMNKENIK